MRLTLQTRMLLQVQRRVRVAALPITSPTRHWTHRTNMDATNRISGASFIQSPPHHENLAILLHSITREHFFDGAHSTNRHCTPLPRKNRAIEVDEDETRYGVADDILLANRCAALPSEEKDDEQQASSYSLTFTTVKVHKGRKRPPTDIIRGGDWPAPAQGEGRANDKEGLR